MATSYETRLGTSPEEGTKSPCVVFSDVNITLSGEQTINTVDVVSGNRVLVGNQTDTTENGIWVCASGAWTRATDFNLSEDVTTGVLIPVPTGIYRATFSGSYIPGTTEVTIDPYLFTVPPVSTDTTPTIAVLGASESVFPWSETWVDHARKAFAAEGVAINIFHTGAGAITHRIALDNPDTLTGETRVELTNSIGADIIIIELGLNEAILNVGGRTQAQMIADAAELYSTVRAANPDATICYSRLIPYDEDRHSGVAIGSVKKKYCVPYMHEYSTKTGDTSFWTSEYSVLNQVLSSTMQTRLTNWKALDASIQALSDVDVVIDTNYFRPARLGLTSHDRVHPNSMGHWFILSRVWNEFQTNSTLRTSVPALTELRNLGDFTNMDLTWNSAVVLDSGGDGYDLDTNWPDNNYDYPRWINIFGNTGLIPHAKHWGNQQRPSIHVTPFVDRDIGKLFEVVMVGLWPDSEIKTRLWLQSDSEPTTWSSESPAILTSSTGTHVANDAPSLASGDYWIKYQVGYDVFGPYPITLSGTYSSGGGSDSVKALFVRTTNDTVSSGWDAVHLDTTEYNEASSDITLNTSTGEITISNSSGYTYFRVTGYMTIDAYYAGIYSAGYSRGGVDQHSRFVGAQTYANTTAAFPILNFISPKEPIGGSGETIELITNCPSGASLVLGAYGMGMMVELFN
jgi:hypothetical protein